MFRLLVQFEYPGLAAGLEVVSRTFFPTPGRRNEMKIRKSMKMGMETTWLR